MHLIIPGSLPPPSVASDLHAHVLESCPSLAQRLEMLTATEVLCFPENTGCSPLEWIQLSETGFHAQQGQSFGAGLGPLRAGIAMGTEPVWIADMTSVAIGRDAATMTPPALLELDPEQADALYDAVKPLWQDRGISSLPIDVGRWRIWLPDNIHLHSISPAAVSTLSVSDWWPQDDSMIAWRKLVNEIQMVWHAHPVNALRARHGLEPVNALWLYGGACGWKPLKKEKSMYLDVLEKSFLVNDWATWIKQLTTLSNQLSLLPDNLSITLVGERRIIKLGLPQPSWWQRVLPRRTQNWTSWWTRQN